MIYTQSDIKNQIKAAKAEKSSPAKVEGAQVKVKGYVPTLQKMYKDEIVAKLMKKSRTEKSASFLAASSAQATPPRSATFSETVSFPFTLTPYESKPSN